MKLISRVKPVLVIIGLICSVIACTNAPIKKHDICYGLQGEQLRDCILRYRPLNGIERR
jgi:hypothetical protein